MKPTDLILRCYAQKEDGDLWVAVCLDLTLAAQGETFEEARKKLHEQITDYLFDALEGEDQDYAPAFLTRKAPAREWARYYAIKAQCKLQHLVYRTHSIFNGSVRLFKEAMPLRPYNAA